MPSSTTSLTASPRDAHDACRTEKRPRPNRETILGLHREDLPTRLLSLFAVAMAGLIAVPALAQTPPPDATPTRVRGTVEKLDDHNLTVKSRDGQSLSITLAPDVDIITLVKKSLADIKPGDFVAPTGVKDKDGKIYAIEARIFPKATPDGGRQFAWDLMPDSVMTNATVGTVTKAAQGAVLHVTFTGGEFRIQHRPGRTDPGERSRRYEPVEAWRGGVRHRLKETRRHRDRGTALCRKRRDQAADVTHPHLPAPLSVTLGGRPGRPGSVEAQPRPWHRPNERPPAAGQDRGDPAVVGPLGEADPPARRLMTGSRAKTAQGNRNGGTNGPDPDDLILILLFGGGFGYHRWGYGGGIGIGGVLLIILVASICCSGAGDCDFLELRSRHT